MTAPERQNSTDGSAGSDILAPGTRLQNLEIRAVLGVGAFHITYRAWDPRRECDVVIHEYLPAALARRGDDGAHVVPEAGERGELFEFGLTAFLQEARQLAQIHDPNIVRVVAYAEANGTAYMVSEFEEGQTLADFLHTTDAPLDESALQAILRPLLAGLRTAHSAGLLHRGICPRTIRLRRQGPPLLVEFANAKVALAVRLGRVDDALSPAYSAFEQSHERGESGPWTDLYALGATLYHCISGHPPVPAADRLWAVAQQEDDPQLPAIETGGHRYTNGVLATIDWMVRPFAVDRPQSVDALTGLLSAPARNKAKPEVASTGAEDGAPGEHAGHESTAPTPERPSTDRGTRPNVSRTRPSLFAARAARMAEDEQNRKAGQPVAGGTYWRQGRGDRADTRENTETAASQHSASPGGHGHDEAANWRTGGDESRHDAASTDHARDPQSDGDANDLSGTRPALHELVPEHPSDRLPARLRDDPRGAAFDVDFDPQLQKEARRARATDRARRRRSTALAFVVAVAAIGAAVAWWWDDVSGMLTLPDSTGTAQLAAERGAASTAVAPSPDPATEATEAASQPLGTPAAPREAPAVAEPEAAVDTAIPAPTAAEEPAATAPDTPEPAQPPMLTDSTAAAEAPTDAEAAEAAPATNGTTQPANDTATAVGASATQLDSETRARIDELVAAGHSALERGRLGFPPEDNAWLHFRAILELDPDNARAVAGLEQVAEGYVDLARYAMGIDRPDRALQYLDRADEVVPGLESTQLQREALRAADTGETQIALTSEPPAAGQEQAAADEQSTVAAVSPPSESSAPSTSAATAAEGSADAVVADGPIGELLQQAREARAAGRYTSPPGDNALWYYQSILVMDGGNEAARSGVAELVDHHIELANEALQRADDGEAEAYLATASAIAPQSERVRVMRERIRERREAEAAAEAAAAEEQRRLAQESQQAQREQEAQAALLSGVNAYYESRYDDAFRLLVPLARQGNPRAQFRVAVMYERGRGVARNRSIAEEWVRSAAPAVRAAAEAGEAWAQADLGAMYDEGWTVPQDLGEAVRWYEAAAAQGYAGAQTNLGVLLWAGRGVSRDREQALELLRLAAAQGDYVAQQNLDQLGVR